MRNLSIFFVSLFVLLFCSYYGKAQTTVRHHYSGVKEVEYNILDFLDFNPDDDVQLTADEGFVLLPGTFISGEDANSIVFRAGVKAPSKVDKSRNWTQNLSFDENGNIYAGSKSFFDNSGRNIQNQSLLVEEGDVLASQTVYDKFGRPVINTLPAPLHAEGFRYKYTFISSGNTAYDEGNFGGTKEENPDPIDTDEKGTLGWYYSQNNDAEPLVDASEIPYERVKYYKHKSGEVQAKAGAGEAFQLGSGREGFAHSTSSFDLPKSYLDIANEIGIKLPSGEVFKVMENTSISPNGELTKSYSDLSGQVLITAEKSEENRSKRFQLSLGEYHQIDLRNFWDENIVALTINHDNEKFLIRNDADQILVDGFLPSPYNFHSGSVDENDNFNYNIVSNTSFSVVAIYLKEIGIFGIKVPVPIIINSSSKNYQSELKATKLYLPDCASNIAFNAAETGYFFEVYNITDDLKNLVSEETITSRLTAGKEYRIKYVGRKIVQGDDQPTITYTSCEGNEAHNYYNKAGELIVAISPKGVEEYKNGVPYNQIDKTTYTYNNRGFLSSTTSNDAGTSNYKYAKDGRIRFSQNAEQKERGVFSYTDYDELGRPIESGEFNGAGNHGFAILYDSDFVDNLIEDRGFTWGDSPSRTDWVRTYYDVVLNKLELPLFSELGKQRFTAGNVSWTENENSATYYSYDELGRVEWMVQTNEFLPEPKKVEYTYDFLGNVLEVAYQSGETDAFYHHYEYDKSKRLKKVYTSLNGTSKDLQATYHYYMHGPLKRVELADKLQGIDYVYNINGLLKGINLPDTDLDPGNDGTNDFANDVFASYYHYYDNDYNKQNSISTFGQDNPLNVEENFDGNISQMIQKNQESNSIKSNYFYDDRKQVESAEIVISNSSNESSDYYLSVNYDQNGNILGLERSNLDPDDPFHFFDYSYKPNTNQLANVSNLASMFGGGDRSYQYNAIGQMTRQTGAYMQDLSYNATGLVKSIITGNENASYAYDDRGHRVRSMKTRGPDDPAGRETVYIRDASGNVLSIYQGFMGTYTQAEVPIYGASRLGSYQKSNANRTVYELKDHLGNVRAVIDRNKNANGDPVVHQSTDYWPFGMVLRSTINGEKYRYGYQGEYAEDETDETGYNSFQLRLYDPVIGRWFAPDPYGQYPSPYLAMGNNPVSRTDPDGGFDSWVGAFIYKMFNGGGDIMKSEWGEKEGEYFVSHSGYSNSNDGIEIGITRSFNWDDGSNSYGEYFWYNNARNIIPDVITFDVNIASAFLVGGSNTYSLNLITRGEDMGFYKTQTLIGFGYSSKYEMWKYGAEFDAGVNVGGLWFGNNAHSMKAIDLTGRTRVTTLGLGVGGSYIEAITKDNTILMHGGSVGIGVTLGGSHGKGFTKMGWGL